MKKTIFIVCLGWCLIVSMPLLAQHTLSWSNHINNKSSVNLTGMVTESDAVYATGVFSDSLFAVGDTLVSMGNEDVFIIKYDKNGEEKWVKQIGDSGSEYATAIRAWDKSILVSGKHTATFVSDSIVTDKLFIAEWEESGQELWSLYLNFKGNASVDVLERGPDNIILAGGMYRGELSIGSHSFESHSKSKAFLLLINPGGEIIHLAVSSGDANHRLIAATYDKHAQFTLMFSSTSGSFIFPDAPDNETVNRSETDAIYLIKTSTDIQQQWSIPIRSSAFMEGVKLLCDEQDNVYVGINYNGALEIGSQTLEACSQLESVLLIMDKEGKAIKNLRLANKEYSRLKDMLLINGDELLITGHYHGASLLGEESAMQSGNRSTYAARFNSSGSLIWHDELYPEDEHFGKSVSLTKEGDILLAGGYIDYGAKGKQSAIMRISNKGVYINKYHSCQPIKLVSTFPAFICPGDTVELITEAGFKSYVWNEKTGIDNNRFLATQAGTYIVQAIDRYGCVGNDTIQVDEYPPTSIYLGGVINLHEDEFIELVADSTLTEYYWSDGYLGRSRYINYLPDSESLELSLFGKSKDHCLSGDSVIIHFKDKPTNATFEIYPVPVKDQLDWAWSGEEQELLEIFLFDSRGILLLQKQLGIAASRYSDYIFMQKYKPGTYFLRLNTANETYNRIFVKQ
jgi:hypothetical protein